MSRTLSGALLVVASAMGFGFMPIFALYAYAQNLNVNTLLFYRFSLAALLLLGVLILSRNKVWPNRSQLGMLFVLGGVFYALQSTCYFNAVRYISPGLAALVLYTYPVFVALLSAVFNGERLTSRVVASLSVSLLGVVLIIGSVGNSANPLGIAFALAAALVYSGYIVTGSRLTKQLPSMVASGFVTLFAAVSFLIIGTVSGELHLAIPAAAWPPVLGLTLIATVLAILAFFAGMERVGSTRAAILSTTEPFMTAALSALLLGQTLSPLQLVGGFAVLGGAILVVLPKKKAATAH